MTYFGGCQLEEHDTDPDSSSHRIVPGTWREATCAESDEVRKNQDLTVWSGHTDTEGRYGEALMFTSWGSGDGRTPVVADVRYMDKDKPCEHRIYEVAG